MSAEVSTEGGVALPGELTLRRATLWMIVPSFYPLLGGSEVQVKMVSKLLAAKGWSIRVLTRRHGYLLPEGLPAKDEVDGVALTRVFSRGSERIARLLFILNGLLYLMRKGRHSIYHAHDVGSAGWLAVLARYLFGGRCIVTLRSGRQVYERRVSTWLGRLEFRTLLRLVDRVLVVNSQVETFVQCLGVSPERVIQIPNGVDTSFFSPAQPERKATTRRQLGLPVDKTICLYIGRLAQVKGVDILIRSWALLPDDVRARSLLVIVGGGTERDVLEEMIDRLGVQKSTLMAGPHQEVRAYYRASDIFVLPSRSEGLSNALSEAMACGMPAVASEVGGAIDLINRDVNSLLFEPENHRDLAEKLTSVIRTPLRWVDMGKRARKTVIACVELQSTVDRIDETYSQLAQHS